MATSEWLAQDGTNGKGASRFIAWTVLALVVPVAATVSVLLWLYWPRLTTAHRLNAIALLDGRFTLSGIAITPEAMEPHVGKSIPGWECLSDSSEGRHYFQGAANTKDEKRLSRGDLIAIYREAVDRLTRISGRRPMVYRWRWDDPQGYPRQSAVWEGVGCHAEVRFCIGHQSDSIVFVLSTGPWNAPPSPNSTTRARTDMVMVDGDADPRAIVKDR